MAHHWWHNALQLFHCFSFSFFSSHLFSTLCILPFSTPLFFSPSLSLSHHLFPPSVSCSLPLATEVIVSIIFPATHRQIFKRHHIILQKFSTFYSSSPPFPPLPQSHSHSCS